jgi:stage 0 sporulation protein J
MNEKKRGLGRGLNALINTGSDTENNKENTKENHEYKEVFINISLVEPNRNQPRKEFDKESLSELANSIKQYGILQPIIVQKNGDMYEIIAGERRWRAAKEAGLTEVPVIVRDYDKQKVMEISIIENIQREDLNPIEEAMAYQSLMEEYGLKHDELAEKVSKNRSTITNSMRLLKLSKNIQQMLIDGRISTGHAKVLLSVEDINEQEKIAQELIDKSLSVRELEKLVKKYTKPRKKKDDKDDKDYSLFYREYEDRLKDILGTKVQINTKDKNKGRIEIDYYSAAELERIVELLNSIV